MIKVNDSKSIAEEVYEVRRLISERYHHDPSEYAKAMREKQRQADALGMSFADFCLMRIKTDSTRLQACSANHAIS